MGPQFNMNGALIRGQPCEDRDTQGGCHMTTVRDCKAVAINQETPRDAGDTRGGCHVMTVRDCKAVAINQETPKDADKPPETVKR